MCTFAGILVLMNYSADDATFNLGGVEVMKERKWPSCALALLNCQNDKGRVLKL